MLNTLHDVDVGFFQQWLGDNLDTPTLSLTTHKGENVDIPIVFAKKSGTDITEADDEGYPKLSIESFTPEPRREDIFPYHPRFGIFTKTDGEITGVSELPDPLPLDFKYEVNFACKRESVWDAFKLYLYKTFNSGRQASFLFNKISVPLNDNLASETNIGDQVSYKFSTIDPIRSDGVFETKITFILSPWVQLLEAVPYETLERLNINSGGSTLESLTQV